MPTVLELGLLSLLSTAVLAHPQFPNFNHHRRAQGTGYRYYPVSQFNANSTTATAGAPNGGGAPNGLPSGPGASVGPDGSCTIPATLTLTQTDLVTVTVTPSAAGAGASSQPLQPGSPKSYANSSIPAAAPIPTKANSMPAPIQIRPSSEQQSVPQSAAAAPSSQAAGVPSFQAAGAPSSQAAAAPSSQTQGASQPSSVAAAASKPISSPSGPASSPSSSPSAPSGAGVPAGDTAGQGGNYGNGKRGVAYDYPNPGVVSSFKAGDQISWAYDWTQAPPMSGGKPAIDTSRFMYIPTLKQGQNASWTDQANTAITSYSTKYLFCINEPDTNGITPAQGADYFKNNMMQFHGRVSLGAPSVTNGNGCDASKTACTGVDWVTEFIKQCAGCQYDFFNLHWYAADTADAKAFTTYLDGAISTLKQANGGAGKFFITEFSPTGLSASDTTAWLTNAMAYLDKNADVTGYSYFLADTSSPCASCAPPLCQSSGLTSMGTTYTS